MNTDQTNEILAKLWSLKKGDELIYYVGWLDTDRKTEPVRTIAFEAWKEYEAGRVTLAQRRVGVPTTELFARKGIGFEYIAQGLCDDPAKAVPVRHLSTLTRYTRDQA